MFERLPENRKALIDLYQKKNIGFAEESIGQLEPSTCAQIRDFSIYKNHAYPRLLNHSVSIMVGKQMIEWINLEDSELLLNAVDLQNIRIKAPCHKRIQFIEKKMIDLSDDFYQEIQFIGDFTSAICWMENDSSQIIGNAAFYEIPHCTFFSDFAMYSLPPEIILTKEHAGYAILENLYHEALHHQMHAYSTLCTQGYLTMENISIEPIRLPWRDRTFTLLEAIHALHIYSLVTPMRKKYLLKINDRDEVIIKLYQDGLKMWEDLTNELKPKASIFKKPWQHLLVEWQSNLNKFRKENYDKKESVECLLKTN